MEHPKLHLPRLLPTLLATALLATASSAQFPAGPDDVRFTSIGTPGNPLEGATEIAVAYSPPRDLHLVIWIAEDGDFAAGEEELYGRMIDGQSGLPVSDVARLTEIAPAADPTRAPTSLALAWEPELDSFLAVWSADDGEFGLVDNQNEIFGRRVNWLPGPGWLLSDVVRISDSARGTGVTDRDATTPTVAYGRLQQQWMVAWSSDAADFGIAAGEREIRSRPISVLDLSFPRDEGRVSEAGVDGDPAADAFSPTISYHEPTDRFLVLWSADDIGGPWVDGHFEIQGRWLSAATGDPTSGELQFSNAGDVGIAGLAASRPALARDPVADAFLVVFEKYAFTEPARAEIYGRYLPVTGAGLVTDVRLTDMGPDDLLATTSHPRIGWDPLGRQFLLSWTGFPALGARGWGPGVDFEVWGRSIVPGPSGLQLEPRERISGMGDGAAAPDQWWAERSHLAAGADGRFLTVWSGSDDLPDIVEDENEVFGELVHGSAVFRDGFETGATTRWSVP